MQPASPKSDPPTPDAKIIDVPEKQEPAASESGDFQSKFQGYELEAPTVDDSGVDDKTATETRPAGGPPDITWQASEYVHHEKDMIWFVVAAIVTVALAGIAVFLKQWTFAVLVLVMGASLIIYGRRPPRILHYAIGSWGVSVEQKEYKYEDFRAFGILQDGALYSILLFPRKRFMPAVTMYFPDTEGEKIVDVLSSHLPAEPVELEFIDRLTRKLRF